MSVYVLGGLFIVLLIVDFVTGSAKAKGATPIARAIQAVMVLVIIWVLVRYFYFKNMERDTTASSCALLLDLLVLARIVDFQVRKNLG